jgi:S-DNA-T family DNA segregation ATPase FtsK/SpoIIIE
MLYIFGAGSLFLLVVMVLLGGFMMVGKRPELKPSEFVGYGLFVFSGAVLCHLIFNEDLLLGHGAGGLVGELLGDFLVALIGRAGTYIFSVSLGLLALMLVTDLSLGGLLVKTGSLIAESATGARTKVTTYLEYRRRLREERAMLGDDDPDEIEADDEVGARVAAKLKKEKERKAKRKKKTKDIELDADDAELDIEAPEVTVPVIAESGGWSFGDEVEDSEEADAAAESAEPNLDPDVAPSRETEGRRKAISVPVEIERPPASSTAGLAASATVEIVESAAQRKAQERRDALANDRVQEPRRRALGDYELPSVSFLNYTAPDNVEVDTSRLQDLAGKLIETLAHFNVQGEVVKICPGPVITMFEFLPAPGIKLSKIAGLSDDIAMGLSALSVRIIAPIPGKGVVGIEIPNDSREIVYLKEIVADETFGKSRAKMPLALG